MNISHTIYKKCGTNFPYPAKIMERPYSDNSQTSIMLQSVLQMKKSYPESFFALSVTRGERETFIDRSGKENTEIIWI